MIISRVYLGMSIVPTLNITYSWQPCYCYVYVFRRSRFEMESVYFINLMFIFVFNVFFFFSGVFLNSVVIISFWRSVQLRKKLCHFMIMVLSCCDLLSVLINNPYRAVFAMLLMTGKLDVNATWPEPVARVTIIFLAFSVLALLVMNFDRYLATSYPLFHRTSVTKRRLLNFFAILMMFEVCSAILSLNEHVISFQVHLTIFFVLVSPPMLFFNTKLLAVIRKNRRDRGESSQMKKTFSLKNISSCLLAVACYVTLSIPAFVYAGLKMRYAEETLSLDHHVQLIGSWGLTIASMNPTFDCLIFYWKNKVLRTEGLKVINSIKIWQGIQSWFNE